MQREWRCAQHSHPALATLSLSTLTRKAENLVRLGAEAPRKHSAGPHRLDRPAAQHDGHRTPLAGSHFLQRGWKLGNWRNWRVLPNACRLRILRQAGCDRCASHTPTHPTLIMASSDRPKRLRAVTALALFFLAAVPFPCVRCHVPVVWVGLGERSSRPVSHARTLSLPILSSH